MTAKVYFVSAPGRVKIGFTRQPENRLKVLQRSDMEELSMIAIIDGSRFLEKTLHRILSARRLRGEWFVDCPEVRAEIDNAIAGKYPLVGSARLVTVPPPKEVSPPAFSPEFQIIARLCDEAEAAIGRRADKHEVRGHVQSVLAAVDAFIIQRGITSEMLRERGGSDLA